MECRAGGDFAGQEAKQGIFVGTHITRKERNVHKIIIH